MLPVHHIDAEELQRLQESGPLVLVDVRTDAEVARGMIPQARHIPLHELPQRLDELDRAATTVIYCQSGGRSAQACAWLGQQGFAAVMNLQGGILAWARDGRPVEAPR
jgi:rhodanese-related sulfurtransferase